MQIWNTGHRFRMGDERSRINMGIQNLVCRCSMQDREFGMQMWDRIQAVGFKMQDLEWRCGI